MTGLIIRNTGSWYDVRTDDGQLFACKVKGNFRLRGIRSTNPVAVGDRVELRPLAESGTALITEICDRRNYIIRRASNLSKQSHIIAANVDVAAIVVTIVHPATSTTFIDRFIASAEAYRVPVYLIFNKTDLYDASAEALRQELTSLYSGLGYECFGVSAATGSGIGTLRSALAGRVTLFSGNSGVGKSTLLNILVPEARVKTAELSTAHDQGQHTTTFSQLYDLAGGGAIIDTPGIRGFGTFDFAAGEVSHFFREIFAASASCRFGNCTHTHEPGCAVMTALGNREIAESRYRSYLSIMEDKDESKYREKF